MQLIDTHCHLYNKEFAGDLTAVLQRAEQEGVEKFYLPAVDSESHEALMALEVRYPGRCIGMMGLHPCSVNADVDAELKLVADWLSRRPWAAVGEIGLDFYWDRTFERQQYAAFRQQIEWAQHYDIPIVIHSRDAMEETIGVVREAGAKGGVRGIFHCFGGSGDAARRVIDLGLYLGIGGVVTYKNSGLAEALADIPLENMVLETDAPYLAPVPFRGKRNEPSYLRHVVAKLAEVKGVTPGEVARVTMENARKVFGGTAPGAGS